VSKRRTKRPSLDQVAAIVAARDSRHSLVWGRDDELQANRKGELHPEQRKRIKKISIFDPWMRILFGGFLVVFAITQRLESWQFWLPLLIAVFPLGSAINGLFAGRRLTMASVQIIEGPVDEVRPHRSEAIAATLHREQLYMFLLNYEGAGALLKPNTPYRFYVVFDVIRPGIVVAVEQAAAVAAQESVAE
jgi:hypothetical protein